MIMISHNFLYSKGIPRLCTVVSALSYLFLFAVLFTCSGCTPDNSPPNLNNCTQMEIRWTPGILDYIAPETSLQQSIFSMNDKEYIQSFNTYMVTDSKRIKSIANDVSQGTYDRCLRGKLSEKRYIHITCYHDDQCLTSLTVYGNRIVAKDRSVFKYSFGLPNLNIIKPPEIQPYELRFRCALNIGRLYITDPLRRRVVVSYPEPSQWCDDVVKYYRRQYLIKNGVMGRQFSEDWISNVFMCPSAYESIYSENRQVKADDPNTPERFKPMFKCHYAINPNCEPNSPSDMVLLLETQAGWNQHGGPELFTFDNHDPKGGCVLLNDGTVKFIRTEEELRKLRWE
jgi:hypothetical protein